MKRRIILTVATIAGVVVIAWCIAVYIALKPFGERKRDADRAFLPMLDLRPEIMENAFGVYVITFYQQSLLGDGNASRLLQLNELPAKYELTLVLETDRITDASLPILAQLTTTDLLIARDSGLSDSGIADLGTKLYTARVPPRDDHPPTTEDGG